MEDFSYRRVILFPKGAKERRAARRDARGREPGRNDGNAHLALFELFVADGAEDYFGVRVHRLGDYFCGLMHLEHTEVVSAGDGKQNALSSVDRELEQRRGDSGFGRGRRAVLSAGDTDAHQCGTGVFHDSPDVGKVDVDDARVGDKVGNALDGLFEHVVAHGKGVFKSCVFGHSSKQAVVRDDDERVYLFAEVLKALVGDAHALSALE